MRCTKLAAILVLLPKNAVKIKHYLLLPVHSQFVMYIPCFGN
uniref:Uncharacterized protein n=1 Tax=Arundo donax TaxID=35708 RepID=A0A0A9ARF2_ARUDO